MLNYQLIHPHFSHEKPKNVVLRWTPFSSGKANHFQQDKTAFFTESQLLQPVVGPGISLYAPSGNKVIKEMLSFTEKRV